MSRVWAVSFSNYFKNLVLKLLLATHNIYLLPGPSAHVQLCKGKSECELCTRIGNKNILALVAAFLILEKYC